MLLLPEYAICSPNSMGGNGIGISAKQQQAQENLLLLLPWYGICSPNSQVLKMTEFLAVPLAVLHTSACISAKRICTVRFVFLLAGIHNLLCISSSGNGNQNNNKISARGDAIFFLHFRKRNCRRWIVFSRVGNVNFHVHLRSRGRCTEIITKSPLAGM